jgi:hypothetical protein
MNPWLSYRDNGPGFKTLRAVYIHAARFLGHLLLLSIGVLIGGIIW